jgi:hypothetical protein
LPIQHSPTGLAQLEFGSGCDSVPVVRESAASGFEMEF